MLPPPKLLSGERFRSRALFIVACYFLLGSADLRAASGEAEDVPGKALRPYLETHCLVCHDTAVKKGGLDLEKLSVDLGKAEVFRTWVKVHDQVRDGKMPPAKRKRPPRDETDAMLRILDAALVAADRQHQQGGGRAVFRRLNRVEYENSLRDLLALPGLSVRDLLPEDGRAHGFDKVGTALDLSHVQLAKYMEAADVALDTAIAPFSDKPEVFRKRLYPAREASFQNLLIHGDAVFLKDMKYDHGTFPIIRDKPALDGIAMDKFAKNYQGTVGIFRHSDEANHLGTQSQFSAHFTGRYRLKLSLWGFLWDKGQVKPSARTEAVGLTANGRLLGYFDAPSLRPTVHEMEVWLNHAEVIEINAASLWPQPYVSASQGRTAEYVGPGIAIDWLEVEGPLHDSWPPASHRRLFGNLPMGAYVTGDIRPPRRLHPYLWFPTAALNSPGKFTFATVASDKPIADAERLLTDFLGRTFRRPVAPEEVQRYVEMVRTRLAAKASFEEAMRMAYKAALCSSSFLFLKEMPGQLGDRALASRLSYFLWNSTPDGELSDLACKEMLRDPKTLRAQVERMLCDKKAKRFVEDFLDQWLNLRNIDQTSPDARLYPEFCTMLHDAMPAESRAYFGELLKKDLGVAHLIQSDFAMLNQKLAEHYGIPGVMGSAIRRVALPPDAHRGGFLTQAAVLKVTANGTTTSPVKRGVWVQKNIVGRPPEPPPPDIPAVDPDVRGATTIREQLAKHRSNLACAACHARIDPPGFALESYDVIGAWRQRYRSLDKGERVNTILPGGRILNYRIGLPVDPSGKLADDQAFSDINQLKTILLDDERQIARNLASQILVYATGAPVTYADRIALEQILERARPGGYGIRTLVHEVVQSPLFQNK